MLQFIRDFLSRRRRMREFVAAGRELHAMKPFQPDWVDTLAMSPRDDPASNVKADPGYAKPPAPRSEVRRDGFLSRRITPPPMPPARAASSRRDWAPPGPIAPAPSPNTFDPGTTLLVLNLDAGRAPAAIEPDEPWPRNKFEPGGGGDFGGAGASGDWAPRECRREADMPTFDRNDAGDSDSSSSSSSSSSSD